MLSDCVNESAPLLIGKAERAVSYRPRVSLDETLRRVIDFFRATGRR